MVRFHSATSSCAHSRPLKPPRRQNAKGEIGSQRSEVKTGKREIGNEGRKLGGTFFTDFYRLPVFKGFVNEREAWAKRFTKRKLEQMQEQRRAMVVSG